jgi:MFS transporter, DHA1 family, tetracycline resistance protein
VQTDIASDKSTISVDSDTNEKPVRVKGARRNLITLLLVVFLDLFGMGIIYPILPLVFLDGGFMMGASSGNVEIVLGLLLAAYPFAQFIGAPILGKLSDKHGRKPILAISLVGSSIGYALFAVGLLTHSVGLLFFSRVLDGFTGGNISVAFSSIADISTPENKTKNFGLIGMAFGFGIILGPFVGGIFSDSAVSSYFGPTVPFWTAAVLVALTVVLILVLFKETIKEKVHRKINALAGFVDVWRTLKIKELRVILTTVFFMNIGWAFFSVFFPVYLSQRFLLTNGAVGVMLGYIGLWAAVSQGLILRPIANRYSDKQILLFSLLVSPVFLLIALLVGKPWVLYIALPLMAVPFAFAQPSISTLVSNAVGEHSQGEIMGIRQSYISLAQTIPPIIAGFSLRYGVATPLILSAVSIFVAYVIFKVFYVHHEKSVEL